MIFTLQLSRQAQTDLDEIFVWYELQSQGLGFKFISAFENVVNKIKSNPLFAHSVYKNVRCATLKIFPYQVFYIIEDNVISIIAIVHHSRQQQSFEEL